MGLFGKGKKKEEPIHGPEHTNLDMPPPPPPKQSTSSGALPSFTDQKEQDLDLPEIPELDARGPDISMPKISDSGQAVPPAPRPRQDLPAFGRPKTASRNPFAGADRHPFTPKPLPKREEPKPEPHFREEPIEIPPKEEHEDDTDAYKHTPTDIPRAHQAYRSGDAVYLKGEIFRDLLDSIDAALEHHKVYLAKQEKVKNDTREDADYDKLVGLVEDIQRQLVLTEAALFE